jgi:hypothetical protein
VVVVDHAKPLPMVVMAVQVDSQAVVVAVELLLILVSPQV